MYTQAYQVALVVNNLAANVGDIRDVGSIPGSGRSPRRGHGNPLQPSCLENIMDRGAWWAIVHGVAKSWTRLKQLSTNICVYMCVCVYIYNNYTEIRLSIFFAAKEGEALYSQQKQDWELTVAQIMNSYCQSQT